MLESWGDQVWFGSLAVPALCFGFGGGWQSREAAHDANSGVTPEGHEPLEAGRNLCTFFLLRRSRCGELSPGGVPVLELP